MPKEQDNSNADAADTSTSSSSKSSGSSCANKGKGKASQTRSAVLPSSSIKRESDDSSVLDDDADGITNEELHPDRHKALKRRCFVDVMQGAGVSSLMQLQHSS
jgi:hypothetical protein